MSGHWDLLHKSYIGGLAGASEAKSGPTWNEMVQAFSEEKATQEWFCSALRTRDRRQFAIRIIQASTVPLSEPLLDAVLEGVLTDENDQVGPLMVGFRRACTEVAVACMGTEMAVERLKSVPPLGGSIFREAAVELAMSLPPAAYLRGKSAN